MEVDEFSDKISPLNNQVSPYVEEQSATNERDAYKIIDNMRMTQTFRVYRKPSPKVLSTMFLHIAECREWDLVVQ